MTIKGKITWNTVVVAAIATMFIAVSITGLTRIRAKVGHLLQNSTPFQIRTTELQRTLQGAAADLVKVSVSSTPAEFAQFRALSANSLGEVAKAEEALCGLSGKRTDLHASLSAMAVEVNESTEQRLRAEQEVAEAHKLITERSREMAGTLRQLAGGVMNLQATYSQSFAQAFGSSKTTNRKLQEMESLKSSLEQLQTLLLTVQTAKEKKQLVILKSRLNGIVDNFLDARLVKESADLTAAGRNIKQKIPALLEAHAAVLAKQDDASRQAYENLQVELKDRTIGTTLLNFDLSVSSASKEATFANHRQDSAFAQSSASVDILANNSALSAAGLTVDSLASRLFSASSTAEVDRIEADINATLGRVSQYRKVLEQGLGKMGARNEVRLLHRATASLGSMRDLLAGNGGVIAKVRLQLAMKQKAGQLNDRLREMVAGYSRDGRENILTAHRDQEKAAREVNAILRMSILLNLGVGAAVIIISICSGVILCRTIVRPVNSVRDGLKRAESDSDLVARFPVVRGDEIGDMCASYNSFMERVHGTVAQIAGFTEQVERASGHLSDSSRRLTQRAASQAEQATEIASAAEQLSATSSEMARNTGAAAEDAARLKETALAGNEVVRQAIEGIGTATVSMGDVTRAMKHLAESSIKIGEIVSVIDEIADQTNLLALNAAIEAARAGEHGLGFAVVASEVKKLAEKTGDSTREIGEMVGTIQAETERVIRSIDLGVDDVNRGVLLANRAGESLLAIVAGVERVAGMILMLATASHEQSATATAITRTIGSISSAAREADRSQSRNAEEAQRLSSLAAELGRSVSGFRLC